MHESFCAFYAQKTIFILDFYSYTFESVKEWKWYKVMNLQMKLTGFLAVPSEWRSWVNQIMDSNKLENFSIEG